jgi:hypothetical protein
VPFVRVLWLCGCSWVLSRCQAGEQSSAECHTRRAWGRAASGAHHCGCDFLKLFDALTCRWYQNLAARASYAPAPMKGEKAAQVLATMPPRWLPATRPAPPCYFLLHQPFRASRLTHHSYGVLAGALALAGEAFITKCWLDPRRQARAQSVQRTNRRDHSDVGSSGPP